MGHCTRYCVELGDQPRMFSDCCKAPCGSSHPGLPGLPQKVLGLTASAVVINCVVPIGYCVDPCQPWTLELQSQADIHDCWKMDITVLSTAWEQKELTRVTHNFYHKVQRHLPSSCDLSQAVQLLPLALGTCVWSQWKWHALGVILSATGIWIPPNGDHTAVTICCSGKLAFSKSVTRHRASMLQQQLNAPLIPISFIALGKYIEGSSKTPAAISFSLIFGSDGWSWLKNVCRTRVIHMSQNIYRNLAHGPDYESFIVLHVILNSTANNALRSAGPQQKSTLYQLVTNNSMQL